MMIEIREIKPTKSELKKFVTFPIDTLYRDSKLYVPSLVSDEINTLLPGGNPAFDYCESIYFMAFRDGKPVGRIAGIINKLVNERTDKKEGRFGFVDFIDDDEVVDALFAAVIKWAKEKGMTSLTGPLGFTDMDPEGMLVEGFDEVSTQATIYNYEYYPRHMERMGFVKDVDWLEYKVTVPDKVPDKMARVASIVRQRVGVDTIKYTSRRALVRDYGDAIFKLINEAYDDLFGYSPLSDKQIKHYIKMYLPFLPLEDLSMVVKPDGELIGVGIAIPSLSQALIKSRGRLLPFGWYHLLKAFKGRNDTVDLLLIAVKPEYQSKGVNALFFDDLIPYFIKFGYKWADTGHELENNEKVQQQWQYFETRQNKRRRAFTKSI
ncbi:MAG: N-acetyltransferase [Muribaculaceae bacterium]|nr:N-acetyltransferase [Muribaculaceae bacterium]